MRVKHFFNPTYIYEMRLGLTNPVPSRFHCRLRMKIFLIELESLRIQSKKKI